MCDYSLHLVASRPAKVGDKLVTTEFEKSITRGFAAIGDACGFGVDMTSPSKNSISIFFCRQIR
jgi:hypothetical protein